MMAIFNVGDKVRWQEHVDNNDADDPCRYTPVVCEGIVQDVVDSGKVYRTAPQYPPSYAKRHAGTDKIKASKFPAGSVVLRVKVDGRPDGRKGPTFANVHESQVLA